MCNAAALEEEFIFTMLFCKRQQKGNVHNFTPTSSLSGGFPPFIPSEVHQDKFMLKSEYKECETSSDARMRFGAIAADQNMNKANSHICMK